MATITTKSVFLPGATPGPGQTYTQATSTGPSNVAAEPVGGANEDVARLFAINMQMVLEGKRNPPATRSSETLAFPTSSMARLKGVLSLLTGVIRNRQQNSKGEIVACVAGVGRQDPHEASILLELGIKVVIRETDSIIRDLLAHNPALAAAEASGRLIPSPVDVGAGEHPKSVRYDMAIYPHPSDSLQVRFTDNLKKGGIIFLQARGERYFKPFLESPRWQRLLYEDVDLQHWLLPSYYLFDDGHSKIHAGIFLNS